MANTALSIIFGLNIALIGTSGYSGSILNSLLQYEVVRPIHLHHHRLKRDLSTKESAGHLLRTSFLIQTNTQKLKLDVYLNRGLLHPEYVESYQREDGSENIIKNDENCFYHGTVAGKLDTFVALSTCQGLSGVIHDSDGEKYGIEPISDHRDSSRPSEDEHIFFNMKDLKEERMECGVNDTHHDHNGHILDFNHTISHHMVRRNTGLAEKKYISLIFVIDKRLYDRLGNNGTKASLRAKQIANYVDGVYKTIGVRVPLIMVEIWNVFDLSHVSGSAGETLSQFQKYASDVLSKKNYRQDNAQLLTGIDFEGVVVGMAGIGTICGLRSAGVNQDRSASATIVANTVAHEMGHNIGMHHNEAKCSCPNTPCVMNAVASYTPVKGFSSCSESMLKRRIKDGIASCLFDSPTKLFGDPVCGNDFLEEGEECDCGTEEECKTSGGDKCCDAKTCKLRDSAQCAVGPCCSDCKFKSRGTLCRDEMTECDLAEFCTGNSHLCPGNFYKQDGVPCKGDKAYCFEGGCRTHDEQCEVLWGAGANRGEDVCYAKLNKRGNEFGNCGKDKREQFIPCAEENTKCGKLHCKDMKERFPIIGSTSKVSEVTFSSGSRSIQCRVAVVSLGKDLEDPTIVGQGTKCEEGKVCHNYTCTNITSLDFVKKCPFECKNGGVCNNNGHCHCKAGFACPDCVHSGPGGSSDSGQPCYSAEGSGGLSAAGKAMLAIFLLLLLIGLPAFLAYRYRDKIRVRLRRINSARRSRFSKLPPKGKETPGTSPTKSAFRPSHGDGNVTPSKGKTKPVSPFKNVARNDVENAVIANRSNPSAEKPAPSVHFVPSKPSKPPSRGAPPPPQVGSTTPSTSPGKPLIQKKPLPYPEPSPFSKPAAAKPVKPPSRLPPVKPPASKGKLPQWPPPPNSNT